ncbi:ankyrin repeat-containing protein [Canna indica]|uniref:Ankyrin repeat-containing protein n=1 Tax=Canna indica TaxID=4628 RepID=A0AAQ3L901_9LILI|nr:ankyrin repeat-containing protein [Canna indica]
MAVVTSADQVAPLVMAEASPTTTSVPEQLINRALNQAKNLGDGDLHAALLLASSSLERSGLLNLLEPPEKIASRQASKRDQRAFMCPDLYEAATSGSTALVIQLLQPAIDIGVHGPCSLSEVTAERNTVLHIAASLGHTQLATEVCQRERCLLEAENSRADTPLHCAARAGHSRMVSLILLLAEESKIGAYKLLTKKNRLGDTVLHEAVRNGHEKVAEVLMTVAPKLSSIVNEAGISPLYLAVMSRSIPLVETLIRYDHASYAGPNGHTALHAAVLSSTQNTFMLLEWKPNIAEEVDASQSTPLHFAASGDDTEILQMLLNASTSEVYSKDSEGFSPIHVAARVGNIETIKLLLRTCPDSAELLDNRGRNFVHVAAEKKKASVVKYVLKQKELFQELINQQDFEGNTPLHLAVASANSMIVLVLSKDKRIQTNIMNKEGKTPLELANGITRFLPLASIVLGLTYSGAPFSVQRQDQVETDNRVSEKWYDNVSKNLAIVSVLIATVAFSATFNVPGGYDSSSGKAIIHGKAKFKIFMAFDLLAMAFSLVSTILLILVRAVDAQDRRRIFITAISTLWLSIFCMSMAFTVAAICAGLSINIKYVPYFIFLSPVLCILFLDSKATDKAFGRTLPWSRWRKSAQFCPTTYTMRRAKQQYRDIFFLANGLAMILILYSASITVLESITSTGSIF